MIDVTSDRCDVSGTSTALLLVVVDRRHNDTNGMSHGALPVVKKKSAMEFHCHVTSMNVTSVDITGNNMYRRT